MNSYTGPALWYSPFIETLFLFLPKNLVNKMAYLKESVQPNLWLYCIA